MVGTSKTSNVNSKKYDCNKCHDLYFTINDKGHAVACECRDKVIKKGKLKFLNMPEKYKHNTLQNLDSNLYSNITNREMVVENKRDCVEYVKNIKHMDKGLYIFSETKGSGKTHLATAIGNALTNHFEVQTKFSTTLTIIDAIKETYNNDSLTSKKKLLYDIQTVEVLILDDIGVESPTSHTEEVFYSIINERLANNKKTIYTSNLKIEELKLSDRITNRINGSTYKIKMPEESIRGKLAPKVNSDDLKNKLKSLKGESND